MKPEIRVRLPHQALRHVQAEPLLIEGVNLRVVHSPQHLLVQFLHLLVARRPPSQSLRRRRTQYQEYTPVENQLI